MSQPSQPDGLDEVVAHFFRVCARNHPKEQPEEVHLEMRFRSGRKVVVTMPAGDAGEDPVACSHSADGRVLLWFGERYEFTAAQGKGVLLLVAAWRDKTRDVSGAALLEAMDSRCNRLRDAMKSSQAWVDGVIDGDDGKYRLMEPSEIE